MRVLVTFVYNLCILFWGTILIKTVSLEHRYGTKIILAITPIHTEIIKDIKTRLSTKIQTSCYVSIVLSPF